MLPRISIITLGVRDLERTLRFYRDGLGLPTTRKAEQGIVFFQTSGTCLALFSYDELAKDISEEFMVEKSGFVGITLAHNVRSMAEVDDVLRQAVKAGTKSRKRLAKQNGAATADTSPTQTVIFGRWPVVPSRCADNGSLVIT